VWPQKRPGPGNHASPVAKQIRYVSSADQCRRSRYLEVGGIIVICSDHFLRVPDPRGKSKQVTVCSPICFSAGLHACTGDAGQANHRIV
jgi:hypothetical protein